MSAFLRATLLLALAARAAAQAPPGDVGEDDLAIAPGCSIDPAAEAAALTRFRACFGDEVSLARIDVDGDGRCDLVLGDEPAQQGGPPGLAELYVIPGVEGGGLAPAAVYGAAGDGVDPVAVLARGSPIPYLFTHGHDGVTSVLRWDPAARMSSRSAFRAAGRTAGALVALDANDHEAHLVRRFLARRALKDALGELHAERYARAVAGLREAARIDATLPEVTYHLGVAKYAAGVFSDGAVEHGAAWYFAKALEQGIADPRGATYSPTLAAGTHLALARALEAAGDARGALEAYRSFARVAPPADQPLAQRRISALSGPAPALEVPTVSRKMVEAAWAGARLVAGSGAAPPRFHPEQLRTLGDVPLGAILDPEEVARKVLPLTKSGLIRSQLLEEGVKQGRALFGSELEDLVSHKLGAPATPVPDMVRNPGAYRKPADGPRR